MIENMIIGFGATCYDIDYTFVDGVFRVLYVDDVSFLV